MKLFKIICSLSLSALALPVLVSAASSSQTLQVHVPFSFTMAGEEFAPGDYRVQQNDNGIMSVQGNGKAAMALTSPSRSGKPGTPASLQFTGDQQHEYLVGIHVEGVPDRALPVHFEEGRKLAFTSSR